MRELYFLNRWLKYRHRSQGCTWVCTACSCWLPPTPSNASAGAWSFSLSPVSWHAALARWRAGAGGWPSVRRLPSKEQLAVDPIGIWTTVPEEKKSLRLIRRNFQSLITGIYGELQLFTRLVAQVADQPVQAMMQFVMLTLQIKRDWW